MAHLILLEDDISVREDLEAFLRQEGHQIRSAGLLSDFRALMTGGAEVAILDVSLPDGEGFEVAQTLRAMSPSMGIIMLTGRTSLPDRLRGLNGGADHYLGKPFLLPELAAIINALLRRVSHGWRLDQMKQRLVDSQGRALTLSAVEFSFMSLMVSRDGVVVSRDTLLNVLDPEEKALNNRRLDTAICRLRSRWQDMSGMALPLKTCYRQGFSFSEPLHWL
jgi:DNA-binding response OmpR family regulator